MTENEAASRHRKETEEERAERTRREAEAGGRRRETEEERAERKRKEAEKGSRKETEEERAERKRKEAENGGRRHETEEERAERKRREAENGGRRHETEEQRAERKRREAEAGGRRRETEEERAERKRREAETGDRRRETNAEVREEQEGRTVRQHEPEEDTTAHRSVVHKALPTAINNQTSSPTLRERQSPAAVKVAPTRLPSQQEDREEDEYGDDDFEDAFEDDEVLQAQKKIEEENQKLMAKLLAGTVEPEDVTLKSVAITKRHNKWTAGANQTGPKSQFAAGLDSQKHRAQYEKDMERAMALRRLVDLDEASFTLFDVMPMSQYDLYLRGVGGTERQTKQIQAPPSDEVIDIGVQADRVGTKSKGVHAPNDLGLFPELVSKGVGGDDPGEGEEKEKNSKKKVKRAHVDSQALSAFLGRIFPTVRTLLDENDAEHGVKSESKGLSEKHAFSSSASSFVTPLAAGRPVVAINFSTLAPQYMVVAHGPLQLEDQPKADDTSPQAQAARFQGVAVLWNINDTKRPDRVLVADGVINDIVMSPSKRNLVYGALSHGCVCVWDTSEADLSQGSGGEPLRLPSYTTEWDTQNHIASVNRILVSGYNSIHRQAVEETEQLISLDSNGILQFWMVQQLGVAGEHSDGTLKVTEKDETDYGRNVGSTVKLFKSGAISVSQKNSGVNSNKQGRLTSPAAQRGRPITPVVEIADTTIGVAGALDFDISPADTSHLLVASPDGIHHISKFAAITAPGKYTAERETPFVPHALVSPTTCVTCSSADSRLILAGYENGYIRLFLRENGPPALSIRVSKVAIRKVAWSFNRRWIAFVLDAAGQFSVLDFAVASKTVPITNATLENCSIFEVSKEEREMRVAVGNTRGGVDVHLFKQDLIAPSAQRNERWL